MPVEVRPGSRAFSSGLVFVFFPIGSSSSSSTIRCTPYDDVCDHEEDTRHLVARDERLLLPRLASCPTHDAAPKVAVSDVAVLVAPDAEHRETAEPEDDEEGDGVETVRAAQEVGAEGDDRERSRPRRTRPSRVAATGRSPRAARATCRKMKNAIARKNAICARRNSAASVGCSESATTTTAIRRDDQEAPQRRVLGQEPPHVAVMKARTASAAATSVAPPNHSRRRRGSSGA